jgi:hypothetical protein
VPNAIFTPAAAARPVFFFMTAATFFSFSISSGVIRVSAV